MRELIQNSTNTNLKKFVKNSGFSLIELMIATLIGLFILTGIATSYVSSKKASTNRNEFSALEDNGRFALETISKVIEHTGYSPVRNTPEFQFITALSPVVVDNCSDGSKNVVDLNIIKTTSDDSSGDSIGVVHHSDSNLFTDCAGDVIPVVCRLNPALTASPFPEASKIYSSFYVDSVNNNLMCAGSRGAKPEIVAEGVENVQYLYGVDMVDDAVVKADRYIPASLVGSGWNNVVSVQIAILVRSLKPVKSVSESKQFTLLNEQITTPSDRYLRSVFSTTVYLRNTL